MTPPAATEPINGVDKLSLNGDGNAQKRMILYAFMMGCSGHQSPGLWTHPADRSRHHNKLSYWIDHAKLLESGHFDGLFLADVLGGYDVYGSSLDAALRSGAQFPVIDPLLLISAMAAATTNLSFGITATTSYVHPYELARRFSTLDHLTNGRVGWNVVTGYLDSAARQFGNKNQELHSKRYEVADEYMDVVYKLWESSWADDSIVVDPKAPLYTNPERVRPINHRGKYFESVPGPHICEPSPQRSPVIYQAGSSGPGMAFAAKHAEVIFIAAHKPEVAKKRVEAARSGAAAAGRDPASLKVLALLCPIIGKTDQEAQEKYEQHLKYGSDEGALALFGGWTGIDLSTYGEDEELRATESNAIKSAVENFATQDPSVPKWNKAAVAKKIKLGGLGPTIVGSPESIADQLQRWVDDAGVDGFNLAYTLAPGTFQDFVELVVPVLKERGLVWGEYPTVNQPEVKGEKSGFGVGEKIGITSREKLYGLGQKRFRKDHYASKFAWRAGEEPPALD
ncbi:related to dibenzothiophene desulfurizing enzyme [Melanopsichium pennsylvanicum]|uniref:Related to dibenzothiophene desulfurizing enzyme n=2 Tax=Melanopsichium pennsylvanicum TaxID=63383 RepID=A0AAJ4XP94_9BASI|nr:related to dibenzothiophene desulfurizing enzyme [Melanopsichium pennsylvanicum 4]SNX85431.1 related to dibenzothiophene desulfurizing enzyme [Melanopsichium pennsylvanicum]